MRIERMDRSAWGSGLPASGFEVFHTPAALDVLERHAAGDRYLVGGYRGEQLLGMVPLFVREVGGLRVVSSPPPGLAIPGLGPLVMPASPKRRKREKVNREFTEGVLDLLDADSSRTLIRMIGHPGYPDPRPYRWAGLDTDPSFTYRLDIGDRTPDDLKKSFSRSLRREIDSAAESEIEVGVEGIDGARTVFRDVAERYADQDEHFGPTWAYVRDLVTSLDDRARVYVARDADGAYQGGIIVLYSNDAAYYWLGGARSDGNSGTNSLLHWRIIEDVATEPPVESVHEYDLVGANTEHLCRYKAKFGADLITYYTIESGGPAMTLAKEGYQVANAAIDRLFG